MNCFLLRLRCLASTASPTHYLQLKRSSSFSSFPAPTTSTVLSTATIHHHHPRTSARSSPPPTSLTPKLHICSECLRVKKGKKLCDYVDIALPTNSKNNTFPSKEELHDHNVKEHKNMVVNPKNRQPYAECPPCENTIHNNATAYGNGCHIFVKEETEWGKEEEDGDRVQKSIQQRKKDKNRKVDETNAKSKGLKEGKKYTICHMVEVKLPE